MEPITSADEMRHSTEPILKLKQKLEEETDPLEKGKIKKELKKMQQKAHEDMLNITRKKELKKMKQLVKDIKIEQF